MLLYLVGAVGLTIILTRGSIFARVRKVWPSFLGCPLCVGAWVGAGLFFLGRESLAPARELVAGLLAAAGAVSVGATLVDFVLAKLDEE
jgi:hypothetical protein